MKHPLLVLLLTTTSAMAAPWNADCVTWYGSAVAVEERTADNCPSGRSHWDSVQPNYARPSGAYSNQSPNPISVTVVNSNANWNPSTPTLITTNAGNVLVVPRYSGGNLPSAVLNVSKGK